MLNLLFIAPDVALLSNESVFTSTGSRAQDKFDLTAMRVLDKVCDASGCQLIICGKWRSPSVTPAWWTSFFRMKGLKNCTFIGQTPSSPTPRQAIEDWLRGTPIAIDKYAIFDSSEGYDNANNLVSPQAPMTGLRLPHALEIIHHLKPDSELLKEWSDVWGHK